MSEQPITNHYVAPNEPVETVEEPTLPGGVSRRTFLKVSAATGGTAAFLGSLLGFGELMKAQAQAADSGPTYPLLDRANQIYSVCLQCNTGCGIKVKLLDGVAVKIDGNPYNPMTMHPHLDYTVPAAQTGPIEGALCPKGQSGLQSVYDPYRLVSVVKRKPGTPRGGGEWVTISFEDAIREIVEGGDLFGEGPVPGLRESYALTDPTVAKQMADAVKAIQAAKTPEEKQALIADFKTTFADHLDTLIDPDHPDLGPKNNQVVFAWGRLKAGRSEFYRRWINQSFGSVNAHGHTTVCQGSLYFTGKAMSDQYTDGKWTGGSKAYWQADLGNARFAIIAGSSIFEGGYGPPLRTPGLTQNTVDNGLKFVVVDPRFSKTAAKAWKWLPAVPGSEGAMAMGLIQWIIANERYDARYLSATNKAAAAEIGEPTWTEAAWLVKLDADGKPTKFLRASEIGLKEVEERPLSTDPEKTFKFDYFVALVDGQPVAVDPNAEGAENAVFGDLLVDTEIEGIRVKSGLQIIADSANEKTLAEWAEICGVRAQDLETVAREFTSHGKRAVADIHRGVSQHTNGFYNVLAWYTLNALIGNFDWAGGLVWPSTYSVTSGYADINDADKKQAPFGTTIIRSEAYEKNTLFLRDGYPAKRNWYPLATDVYQEIAPSIGDAYPYPVKALFLYMGSPIYALPAGHTNIDILRDPKKLPLFVASDAFIGETTMYADYIFPDTMYLERWEFHGTHPNVPFRIQPVRNPAIDPLVPDVTVYGQQMPLSLEAMLLGLAEELQLPGFGPNGFGEGKPFVHQDDLYIRMVANLSINREPVPDADEEEIRIFTESRRHLRKSVFDVERWQAIAGELWPKVVYVMNRGGRFQNYSGGYRSTPRGQQLGNRYGKMVNIYQEKTYDTRNSMTGERLKGYATYVPPGISLLGEPVSRQDEQNGFDLHLITYREIVQTKSRTASNYWLLGVLPENFVLMNAVDARARGLADGDVVRVISPTNLAGEWDLGNGSVVPMVGKVKVAQGIRPGVIAVSLGFGHWAYGSRPFTINGVTIPADERRGRGLHINAAMRTDPHTPNTTLVDPVGGSAVFYDTMVRVEKV
ncbi:molybdopterin dinucleotide binding domain-containing protein [Aggregatilineales bacterium SYSU G02658]